MQDIRKPYSRSRSNHNLSSKVEEFESRSWDDDISEESTSEPVHIPIKRIRRNINEMDMYPHRRRDDVDSMDGIRERPRPNVSRDVRFRSRNSGDSTGTWAFIVTIVILVIGAWLLTYVFNNATATIVPKYQDIEVRKTITFSKTNDIVGSIDFIVATSSINKSKQLPLSETKKVEAKASGRIIIYNNFDAEPQKLIKNTRFESTSGKIYRINQSVTVPGKKEGKPGTIEVTIYADGYGADYNIAPSDFTIPGFKGSPRYTGFFARSNGSISGGASGNMSLASLSDINAAKDALALELATELKTELTKVEKDGYVELYSAIEVIYVDNEKDVLAGVNSTYQVTGTGYLMLAPSSQLAQNFANEISDYKNNPVRVRLEYEDTITYARKDTDHINENENLTILVEGKPRIIWDIDEDAVKKILIGMKRTDFKPLMATIDAVKGAEIGFSPFWLSAFPMETSKIAIVESLPKR